MQQKSIQLKYVNKKSLHEINFVHNDCLDSVFLQHMHTFFFMTAFDSYIKLLFYFHLGLNEMRGSPKRLQEHDESRLTHDNNQSSTCKIQHDLGMIINRLQPNQNDLVRCLGYSMGSTW